jgi:periplasmic mercuric ion binding protein
MLRRVFCTVAFAACLAAAARAEVTVTVSEMHLCCPGCTHAVEKAVAKVKGATCVTSEDEKTTVLTAPDLETLQKALDRMARAGFCGELDSEDVKFAEIEAPEGVVQRLEIAHVHNCCGACTKAIKGALAEVEGVVADTCKAKETKFVIEGNFEAKEALAALSKAGFYARLPKPKS